MHTFISAIDYTFDMVLRVTLGGIDFWMRNATERPRTVSEEVTPNTPTATAEVTPTTFRSVEEILHAENTLTKNTVMYAGTVHVPLYRNPTIEFDAQLTTIPYGEMVMMLEPRGRFFRVVWNTFEGWVLKDDLVDRAVRVYPEFSIGGENLVDHENTSRVRAIIGDTFGLSRSEFSLQAGEYVLYKLWRKGIHLTWPQVHPRTPGTWHKILKGTPGVHVSVTPKAGSIMEYVHENEIGHVAYVEAVFPDAVIAISEANYPESGIYNERELTKEEWKELRPVFIYTTKT